ncbi:choice-of-anchor Q domain-containing protein [Thiotrichales bacterium HSG1]|nr:choice-of-anchor Q domain-containing protein [Thiotrichales bacterium HSG1]
MNIIKLCIITFCLLITNIVFAATITVTNNSDSGTGSLRQAITDATTVDTIDFFDNYYITLSSQLTISKNLTIDAKKHRITLDGNLNSRIFQIDGGMTTLKGLTIRNGKEIAANGGGILVNSGSVLTVENSLFLDNSAADGGGIYNNNSLTITNSTFVGNSATNGAGFFNARTAASYNNTFSGNTGEGLNNAGNLFLKHTIIANSSVTDCINTGTISTNVKNLIENNSCSPTFSGDPKLDSLKNNGGTTQTFALLTGSPAINTGNTTCGTTVDQRGFLRPQNGKCDIGAYETSGICTTQLEIPQAECETLVALYDSTNGASWSDNGTNNWNITTTPCTSSPWVGITCTGGYVTSISRNGQNLNGTIPDLSALTSLQELSLYNNSLSGTIPNLSNLINLQHLRLKYNGLTGTIPDLTNLNSLQTIWLEGNQLIGNVPTVISGFTTLREIILDDNQLDGTIPNLNSLSNLQIISLGENQLSGTVPALNAITGLSMLILTNNQLSGTIPSLPASLSLTDLDYNAFTDEEDSTPTTEDSDWRNTQTVPPTGLNATNLTNTSIDLNWTPIIYTGDGGEYQIKYSTNSGGPYSIATTTAKSIGIANIGDLTAGTTYYFVIETSTPSHDLQQNDLTSILSSELPVTTTGICNASITVTNANDTGAGSLRQAITDLCPGGSIDFDSLYTINIANTFNINKNLTIDGSGQTIDGGNFVSINIANGTTTINNLNITGTTVLPTAINAQTAIEVAGVLNLNDSKVHSNNTNDLGSIYVLGIANITNSTIADNASNNSGAGIYNEGILNINNSTISRNSAGNDGGGVYNEESIVTIINGTISGNSAGNNGGGLYNINVMMVRNSTIYANSASVNGGGIYNGATINLKNTIIAGSSSGGDCVDDDIFNDNGNNLIEDGGCGTPVVSNLNINPTLANNGGSTETHELLSGSVAIDAGNGCEATDQRGTARPQGAACDVGAYELLSTPPIPPILVPPTPPVSVYYKLTVEKIGNGTVTDVYGINCGNDCEFDYVDQTELTLTATPDNNWSFTGWTGDCETDGSIRINKDKTCTATFAGLPKTLTITPATNGVITSSPKGINCGTECEYTFDYGQGINLTASPNDGFQFDQWQGCDGTVSLYTDITCAAKFKPIPPLQDNETNETGSNEVVKDGQTGNNGTDDNTNNGTDDNTNTGDLVNVKTVLDAVTEQPITLQTENCHIVELTSHIAETGEHDFPQGVISYKLSCQEAKVTVYFHAIKKLRTLPVFKKYGPTIPGDPTTNGWYILPNVTFDISEINGEQVVAAHFTLKDGELGDDTGIDGMIVDPGGIAYSNDVDNVISFISKYFTASRKAKQATITINRNGLIGEFEVDYNIVGNTAVTNKDFQIVNGTLHWDNDERGDKSFTIPISQNATIGSTIQLNLNNLTPLIVGSLLGIETATLTITDDDILTTQAPSSDPSIQSLPTIVDTNFSGQSKTFTEDTTVTEHGNIGNAIFAGYVENNGMIANSNFLETATVVGGKLSGDIVNDGIINDVNFVGNTLTGGMLAGNNVNNSVIGGVIRDIQLAPAATLTKGKLGGVVGGGDGCAIKDVQLIAHATLVDCNLGGNIIGDTKYPAQIGAVKILPGTTLSHVQLSPTVELTDDVVLGDGVRLPHKPPILQDFGLEPEEIAVLDNERLRQLEPAIFSLFTAEDVSKIPAKTFAAINGKQLAEFGYEALDGITSEQFQYLSLIALADLTPTNMAGFSGPVIKQFTQQHLNMLNPIIFQHQTSRNISKILVNLSEDIEPTKAEFLSNWLINHESGAITAPIGSDLTLLPKLLKLPKQVSLPTIIDINKGFGLAGRGITVKESIRRTLVAEGFTDLIIYQSEVGTLIVENTKNSDKYGFMPYNVKQTNGKPSLSIGAGGFQQVATPTGQQYKIIPVPYDSIALSEILNNGRVIVGKSGDVLMEVSEQTRREDARYIVMFDPFIEPAPNAWCIYDEITNESICDFDNAPIDMRPGIHFPRQRAKLELQQAKMVYPDGSSQKITSTIYSPETFIAEGLKFPGVEKLSFNVNGTFYVLYEGKPYIVIPNFNIKTKTTISPPEITLDDKGRIIYSVPIVFHNKTQQKDSQIMLVFDLFIKQIPESWCVEVNDGVFCDFDNMPELLR